MTGTKGAKDKIAGKAKRLAAEIIGDQQLYEEGKLQEDQGREQSTASRDIKPLGNLDKLT